MLNLDEISVEFTREHVARQLRLYIGHGRKYSAQNVSDALEINLRTLNGYLAGETTPGLAVLMKLSQFLGPAFLAGILKPYGFGGVRQCDQASNDVHRLNAKLTGVVAKIGEANADGRIDHRELHGIKQAVTELAPELNQFGDEPSTH